jgi:hypothetical protein
MQPVKFAGYDPVWPPPLVPPWPPLSGVRKPPIGEEVNGEEEGAGAAGLGVGDGGGAGRCTGGGELVSDIAGAVVAGALVAVDLAVDLALGFATFFAVFVDFFAALFLGADDFATFFFLRATADFDTALDFLAFLTFFTFFAMIVLPIVKG